MIKNFRKILLPVLFFLPFMAVSGQTMPAIMDTGSIVEQKAYLEERMNIYNGYRAVRDDIFLRMLKNNLDSLNQAKQNIENQNQELLAGQTEISNLKTELGNTQSELEEAIKNRDSLAFFGVPMSKTLYNMIVWGIILGLIAILILGSIIFKRNRNKTQEMKRDLEQTMDDFENFRKTSSEKSEQMVINHFNEIKKLKEGRI